MYLYNCVVSYLLYFQGYLIFNTSQITLFMFRVNFFCCSSSASVGIMTHKSQRYNKFRQLKFTIKNDYIIVGI